MSEEQKEELYKAQVKGRAELSRAIDIGGLLLNSNAILVVECYLSDYYNCPDFDFYEEHLDHRR